MNCSFHKTLLLALFCYCGYIGCTENQPRTKKFQSTIIENDDNSTVTRENESTVLGTNDSSWNIKTAPFSKTGSLENVYFLDENIGFANSYTKFVTTFYKTIDGGKSWKKLSSIKDFSVDDISFISTTEGFLVASKLKPSSLPVENGSVIMRTIDEGQNWETVYSSVNTSFSKLLFNSDGLGIAIGRTSTPTPYDSENLILLSNDSGQTWTDFSKNLNTKAAKANGRVEDSLTNAIFPKNKEIVVLTLRGKIYKTLDKGTSWTLVSQLDNEPPQTGIDHFGELEDGRFWVSGSTVSIEGKWAMIAVMNNSLDWDRYRLNGYYFADVEFLSNNEVIACGAIVGENNFGGGSESDDAVILFSNNSGKTWRTIHKSNRSNGFTSIIRLSENRLFVGGNNENGVLLEKISNQ